MSDAQLMEQAGQEGAMAQERKRAPATNFLPIVNGRLPLLFVHSVRFKETAGNNELAKKYATSVGKIFDIKKGRNFGYVTEGWKPTQADIDAANGWIGQIGSANSKHGITVDTGDVTALKAIVAEYEAAGLASPEDVAAFDALRASTRTKKAEGAAASSAPAGETLQAASAESLLS